jgi:hypothetical protein
MMPDLFRSSQARNAFAACSTDGPASIMPSGLAGGLDGRLDALGTLLTWTTNFVNTIVAGKWPKTAPGGAAIGELDADCQTDDQGRDGKRQGKR